MKPRLESAPLTEEDVLLWFFVAVRMDRTRKGQCRLRAARADRRDADLMLYAQQHKLVTWVGPPMIFVRNSVSAYWADPPWIGTL